MIEHEIILPIEGLDNEHNALMVSNGLARIRGLGSVRVEVNNKRALLGTQNAETISEAVKAVRDLGYEVLTVKRSFDVLEMSCAACAVSVGSMLKSVPGVVDAVINYATANATVARKSSVEQESTRDERLVPGFDSRGIPPYHEHLKRRLLSALGM